MDNSLKLLPNYELVERMKYQYGEKITCISIGPAGEMKMCAASVAVTDMELRPTRHAGRGGVGAVMGAKRVKAIVLDDTGTKMRSPKDPEKFKEANKRFVEGLMKHPVTGRGLPTYGTNVLTNILSEAGGYPTYNFKEGRFDGAHKISGETQAETENSAGRGRPPTAATGAASSAARASIMTKTGTTSPNSPNMRPSGPTAGTAASPIWTLSPCWISLDDNYGLDTIEMGVTIGVAMEAGLLKFGDAEGAINLVKEVGQGTPLGRILGAGAAVTGKVFGVERVPVVKGQALPAYDPRAVQGIGVTYATSPMGADHTAGYAVTANILKVGGFVDPLKPEGQIELSRNLQIATAAVDSTGMCLFIAFALLDQPETFQALLDLLNSFYGINLTGDDVVALGKKVLTIERDFNARAGFTEARPSARVLQERTGRPTQCHL